MLGHFRNNERATTGNNQYRVWDHTPQRALAQGATEVNENTFLGY
jgi:hypothetical protein